MKQIWYIIKEIGHALNYVSHSVTTALRGLLTLTCLLVISENYPRIKPLTYLYTFLIMINLFSMFLTRLSYDRYKRFCDIEENYLDQEKE